MKKLIKRILSLVIALFSLTAFIGCATIVGPPKVPYQGFTTKTQSTKYYKLVIKNMRRGAITTTMRIDRDTRKYDAIFFDAELYNIHPKETVMAYYVSFKLITDDGSVVDCDAYGWKGAFGGGLGEQKSNDLYPGTKKIGVIGFPLKKTSNPVKLIYDTPYGKIMFNLP